MKTIKENLKTNAKEIREIKQLISAGMRAGQYRGSEQNELTTLKNTYRFNHIAYCMLRGREYREIENKTRPENELSAKDGIRIDTIIADMKAQILERTPEEELQNA